MRPWPGVRVGQGVGAPERGSPRLQHREELPSPHPAVVPVDARRSTAGDEDIAEIGGAAGNEYAIARRRVDLNRVEDRAGSFTQKGKAGRAGSPRDGHAAVRDAAVAHRPARVLDAAPAISPPVAWRDFLGTPDVDAGRARSIIQEGRPEETHAS